jgi:putative transposase
MKIGNKIRLYPNNEQATYFAKACGVSRFAYNWGLARWNEMAQARRECKQNKSPTLCRLSAELNAIKDEQFPWMREVTKCAPQHALMNLDRAWKRYFDYKQGKLKLKTGVPSFKRRREGDGSFYLENQVFRITDTHIYVSKLGRVRMAQPLRYPATKLLSCTISATAGQWYASVSYETPVEPAKVENQDVVGVDLGIKALATLSTGEVFEGPKAGKAAAKRLARLQRSASRKVKGSANRRKANFKVARLHDRITNRRHDALHKLTTRLTRIYGVIVIEDLNVKGMVKNHCLAKSLADQSFGEFRRQLEYKSAMRGNRLVVVDRFFPSSKTCSNCGNVVETLLLGQRTYTCDACGMVKDRDHNAALNLAASSAVTACGVEGSGRTRKRTVKPSTTKQEVNNVVSYV